MGKVHPNQKNQKSRKSRGKNNSTNPLPQYIRDKGIATQIELIMALLPYMEWVSYQALRTLFWKHVTTHRCDGPLRCYLCKMEKQGLIEKKHEGKPPVANGTTCKLSDYLFIRRISKTCPRRQSAKAREAKLKGMYGFDSEKKRAAKAKRGERKPPKTTVTNLTQNDLDSIRANTHGLSDRVMGEMHGIHQQDVWEIRHGRTPAHLKGPRAQ